MHHLEAQAGDTLLFVKSRELSLALLDFWDCCGDVGKGCWVTLAAHAIITKAVSNAKQGQRES